MLLATIYSALHRDDEAYAMNRHALELIDRHLLTTPDDVRALYLAAGALVRTGELERGLGLAEQAVAINPEDAVILYNVSCIYAQAGRQSQALDHLERAVAAGFTQVEWIVNDNDLAPLRQTRRFQALLRTLD